MGAAALEISVSTLAISSLLRFQLSTLEIRCQIVSICPFVSVPFLFHCYHPFPVFPEFPPTLPFPWWTVVLVLTGLPVSGFCPAFPSDLIVGTR